MGRHLRLVQLLSRLPELWHVIVDAFPERLRDRHATSIGIEGSNDARAALSRHLQGAVVVELVLDGDDMVLLFLVLLDDADLLLILVQLGFLISNQITELHLLLDQVLCLGERADELVSLFLLHDMHLLLVFDAHSLQVLFFELQFYLLLAQLLSQALLLLVEVQEDLDISIKFCLLLILDDLFDFSVLHDLLLLVLQYVVVFFEHIHLDLVFELAELLCLLADVLVHSHLHFVQVLLVDLARFPEAETLLVLARQGALNVYS